MACTWPRREARPWTMIGPSARPFEPWPGRLPPAYAGLMTLPSRFAGSATASRTSCCACCVRWSAARTGRRQVRADRRRPRAAGPPHLRHRVAGICPAAAAPRRAARSTPRRREMREELGLDRSTDWRTLGYRARRLRSPARRRHSSARISTPHADPRPRRDRSAAVVRAERAAGRRRTVRGSRS